MTIEASLLFTQGSLQFIFVFKLFAFIYAYMHAAFSVAQTVKNLPAVQETLVGSLGLEDPLQKGMAPQSSILAWEIPWTGAWVDYSPGTDSRSQT